MAFNVINMKHREAPDLWLHIKDENGELMYADDKKKKPVRIKFKSIHGDVFRKAFLKMQVRLSRLKEGKQKEYEELAKENAEVDLDKVEQDIMTAFMQAEDLAIDFITEMAIDWEGFVDQDGNELAFEPDVLHYAVSQIENYHLKNQIRDAFKDAEAFTIA